MAVLDDVTEFVRLDELRTELIGVASHELKSPLTTLRMNLLMLQEKLSGSATPEQELLAAAVDGCEELRTTIEEFLDVTRIEAGQLRLDLAPVDLEAMLTAARRGLENRFSDAGVNLLLVSNVTPSLVLGDASRLGRVVANVLANALKYSPSGGTVTVKLASASGQNAQHDAGGALEIAVLDQGPGIPPDFRERVFDKFFRVEHHSGEHGDGVRGTGIGLYLCREIVKAHGGTISCGPGDGGIGTRIAISLPVNLSRESVP